MHVGFNLIYLVPGETGGMEVYARELIRAIAEQPDAPRLTAFVGREAAGWVEGAEEVVAPVRSSRRIDWVRGEQFHVPHLAAKAGVDLVHSLASTGPATGRFARVTTVHDLIYAVHPEAHFGLRSLGMRILVPLAARRSQRVITGSEASAVDLVKHLHIDRDRIDVVPHGVGQPPRPEIALPDDEVRRRQNIESGRQIVLCTAAKRPHKNLLRLIGALAAIDDRPVVVFTGYATPHDDELRARARELGVEQDIRFTGWVSDEELEGLYQAATCLVFPSLYEGFGLPILEAMARGLPVACSDRSSLPEVAGNAALLFDAEDEASIAAAIERLLHSPGERQRLHSAGLERARMFSWEAAAQGTLRSYQLAL